MAGRFLAVGLGVVLVLLAEGAMRLLPLGQAPSLTIELARLDSLSLRTVNPAFPQRFISGTIGGVALGGFRMAPRPYVNPPGSRTVRVVWVGGSTVQGYPHPHRLSAPAYLQAMLQDAWPERKVEVYNLGITAVASFAVARTVEHALELDPDLVVVSTGHNEYYGVYGAASRRQGGSAYWVKGLHFDLMQTGTAQVVRRAISSVRPGRAPDRSLLALMVIAGSVPPGDGRRDRARHNLGRSLDEIARRCRDRGVVTVFTTLASNDTGFPPDSTADRQAWSSFQRAGALAGEGRHSEARAAYVRARDLDPVPWRASTALNQEIGHAASRNAVVLADVAAAFDEAGPAIGVGWELMADHLHPSTKGQVLMARTVVEALEKAPAPVAVSPRERSRLRGSGRYPVVQGELPVERLAVAEDMATLLEPPPLRRDGGLAARHFRSLADSLYRSLTPPERRGVERWRRQQEPGPLVLLVANQLFAASQYGSAARHYRAARLEQPYTVWGDLWAVARWGWCMELERGPLNPGQKKVVLAALGRARFLAQSPDLGPDFLDFFGGYAMHLLGRPAEALALLEKCATEHPRIQRQFTFDLLVLLSEELVRAGREADARRHVVEVTRRVGRQELGEVLLQRLAERRSAGVGG